MFSKLKIRSKILLPIILIFALAFAINEILVVRATKEAAFDAALNQARSVVQALENSRERMGDLWNADIYDQEKLMADIKGNFFSIVPIVAALRQGEALAEGADFTFRVPKVSPRNPKNEPSKVELEMLNYLKANPNEPEYWIEDKAINSIRYMKPIKLTADCLACHGSLEHSITGTLTDPLGYTMEQWNVGEIHGAFEIIQPLDEVDAAVNASIFSGTALTLVAIALTVLILVLLLNRIITKPLGLLEHAMTRAAEGDLSTEVHYESEDEIGVIIKAQRKMRKGLVELITQFKLTAEQVASAATEIASAAEQSASGAGEQESQAGEVSSSIEQMAATIVESSQNASSATESARNAAEVAGEGGHIVQQTIEGMQAIAESVKASSATIAELGKRSDEIGEIIGVIDDIADQTNLLALNAAIEAARAGEQGRGFAVVADEVRKLAERTTKATAEIAGMIKGIQEDTSGAVASMEEGTTQVEAGMELAVKAGDSLTSIVSVVSEVQKMIEQIATASDEQSAAAEQISGNVGNIASVSKQSAESAEQMAATAEQLNRQTDNLNELVSRFKLDDSESSVRHDTVTEAAKE
ncbi:MAG: DUF3365 domain-containing protein [Candidatus Marinimicrobia bacterium]|nr:DUF3365 domain-containing protein [Candidatus Neomarinimicrobiota bacterium]